MEIKIKTKLSYSFIMYLFLEHFEAQGPGAYACLLSGSQNRRASVVVDLLSGRN